MKAIGRFHNLRKPRLALAAAGLLIVLFACLALASHPAQARSGVSSTNTHLAGSLEEGHNTPMPAAYRTGTGVSIVNQPDQPFISNFYLITLGVAGTALAVGPLALAALLDIRSSHQL
jgi:hypothetical protein